MDTILVRYDKDSTKPKILEIIYNMTDISKTVNSYRNINRDRYNFNYQKYEYIIAKSFYRRWI